MYEHCARRSVARACARRRRSTRCIGSTVNIVVRGSSYATCPVLFVHKGLHTLIVRTSLKRRQLRKRVSRDRESVNVFLCLTNKFCVAHDPSVVVAHADVPVWICPGIAT